jgi:hypothetical protein
LRRGSHEQVGHTSTSEDVIDWIEQTVRRPRHGGERGEVKDGDGKVFTLAHDRFQACCLVGCGLISAHQSRLDAIEAAEKHECRNVEVYDAMSRRGLDQCVWRRDDQSGRTIDISCRKR